MPPAPFGFTALPDINHIGVAGHSFGAFAAHAVGGAEHGLTMGIRNFRDPRVDAIVAVAPPFNDRYGYFDKGPNNNSWNDIASTFIEAVREPDGGGNFDVIDGLFDVGGNCIFLFDLTSPNLHFFNGLIFPESER
ncbi:MAG: hypothetical protein IH935_05870 [Acidobacteria bacterium]|nr:hypothetical protein [Acidobacteriota bacterium]